MGMRIVRSILFVAVAAGCIGAAKGTLRDLSKKSDVNEYVDELTGFGRLEEITKSFTRVDVNDDNTPFLHNQINGKKNIWRVEIKNVRLKLKSAAPGFKDRYVRTFEVLIDPNTGHLLRIKSSCDVNDPDMLPEPPAQVAEEQIRSFLGENYLGFPNEPPKASFLDALDAGLMGHPFLAKEIEALYVIHSRKGVELFGISPEPKPRWVITLRGLPPMEGPRPYTKDLETPAAPAGMWNHSRNIVDAVTGKCLMGSNIPQPLPPEEKKKK